MVTSPAYATTGMVSGLSRILKAEGITGWYKGLVPILMKQVPYTVMQLTVFQLSTDFVYSSLLPNRFGTKAEVKKMSCDLPQ